MATHCKLDDTQATVYINYPIQETLKFKECPIEISVTVNNTGNNTVSIVCDYEQNHEHHPNYVVTWTDSEGVSTDRYSLRLVVCSSGNCGAASPNRYGESFYAMHIVKNGIDTGNHFHPTGVYSASIQSVDYSGVGEYTFIVTDNKGSTLTRIYQSSPQYTVTCDDECPPGTTKCLSTNYPGYCCLPCKEIAGEIKAIASQVRRLNNG
ncbi:hypothetical protein [Aliterella atlantica]|uniref:Uncharacterized protein n=1 Tax=Aliterella atlantica CENA595 TaxID=1618023 RepID=A0A0D8ZR88_9CYAN|nr:hypothetical protein [Aliterella atlantica]KJH71230.1 hypothetical protein UH38_13125 [Aliterella atlantica CENA595]